MLHASTKLSCDTGKVDLLKLLSGFKIFWLGMTTNERLNMSRYCHFTDNYGAMKTPFRLVERFLGFSLTPVAWTFSQIYYVWPLPGAVVRNVTEIEGERVSKYESTTYWSIVGEPGVLNRDWTKKLWAKSGSAGVLKLAETP